MLRGLPASIVLHAAVIASGYIVLPTLSRDITAVSVIVPIELVEVSEVTNVAPRIERETVEPVDVPPPLEDFLEDLDTIAPEEPDEPPTEEDAPSVPDVVESVPEPDVIPEPEDEPEDVPDVPEDRPVLEDPPADPLDDILGAADNLFDRTPRESTSRPPPAPPPTESLQDEAPAQTITRRGAGERTANTARVESFLVQQLFLCWDDVDDLPNSERLNVTFKMTLNRDGTIKSGPTLVDPARAPIGDRAMGVAIDRALRAARRCAPYTLPADAADYYDDWDEVTLNLGPAFRQ